MRKALVVGIDHYKKRSFANLQGCVRDANAVAKVLEVHGDGRRNFDVKLRLATRPRTAVTREELEAMVIELFGGTAVETAVFYYAGHGALTNAGGFLVTSECTTGAEGLPLTEVLKAAQFSPAKNRVIVLDSCHAGAAGARITERNNSELAEGTTILAASTDWENAKEEDGAGVFTNLFVDALEGAAANLVGEVSPSSAYAHIDQSLGSWEQRPVFKANVKNFVSLREVKPPIPLEHLLLITKFFPSPDLVYPLDPSFEPTSEKPKERNTEKFAILQKYNRINLVVPIGAEHMYYAAMESRSCRLTALGRHYWRLVKRKRLGRPLS